MQRHQIAENAGERDHDVDARMFELVERDQRRPGQPAVAIEARRGSHERERLRDRRALGLQVVRAPKDHRDRFGKRIAVAHIALEQPRRLARAVLHREVARDAEGIEAVQIASGRQDLGRPQEIASRRGTHEATIEGPQDRRNLGVAGKKIRGDGQSAKRRAASRRRSRWRRPQPPRASCSTASRGSVWPCADLGHRQQHVDALLMRQRLADDVQAVRDQRVFELEHGLAESGDRGGGGGSPCRLRLGQIELRRLRLNDRGEFLALENGVRRGLAPAIERRLELDQPAIQSGVGHRRRQVADQRRGGATLRDRALGRIVRRIEIEIRKIADQPVRPASLGETGLFARHEFERAVGAEMQHRMRRRSPPSPSGRRPKKRASARSPSRTRDASDRLRSRRRAERRRRRCRTVRRARESRRRPTAAFLEPDPIASRSGSSHSSRRT